MKMQLKIGNKNLKQNSKIGILGFGEVGKAIAKFYRNPRVKDLNRNDGLVGVEILNVCIPWSKDFIKIVKKEIKAIKPKLTIIHSSVAPFATKKIISILPRALRRVVHSPVRGVHPYLHKGIKTFVKYIGADNKKAGQLAKKHLESLGMKTKAFMPSLTTELGKLFDTTYYGICIAWHGEMKKLCDKYKINFDEAVTDFNLTYNEGYKKLGKKNVVRPVLYPPKEGCGGHCVLENSILLKESFPKISQAPDFILNMGKNKSSISEEKPYFDKAWLYAEYWGKNKSTGMIAREQGCSDTNIRQIMKRKNIPLRDKKWTKEQINKVLKLSEEGKTFKEIAEEMESEKTYDAIRNTAYKVLRIRSSYNPSIRDEETRRKISASLQNIEPEDWDGFKENLNALIRKSIRYQEWREKIFKRDNYTCQKCKQKGKYLVAHHITNFSRSPNLRMKMENGISLCKECHLEFHNRFGRKNNSGKQLKDYL